MTLDIAHPILQKAIQGLNVSKEFKAMAKANGYKTLQNILDHPLHELPFKTHSGYRILKELLDILDDHGVNSHLDD